MLELRGKRHVGKLASMQAVVVAAAAFMWPP